MNLGIELILQIADDTPSSMLHPSARDASTGGEGGARVPAGGAGDKARTRPRNADKPPADAGIRRPGA
ncbi:hypothetical protein Sgleb_31170 [Streptomyces glebosus]|uniref:Uncharacterized protein n=1 Tax=Streptomyces glebosus TaxID=249580 RepID=A0A640SVN4_9ACTN|nr:hypothetical protein Sgleb_31170 [Streptomyces glebosus]GHG61104.1 hypothetical protein GCM10010513_26950 [Streptomyces glebosus]